jgi:hypothetical protein
MDSGLVAGNVETRSHMVVARDLGHRIPTALGRIRKTASVHTQPAASFHTSPSASLAHIHWIGGAADLATLAPRLWMLQVPGTESTPGMLLTRRTRPLGPDALLQDASRDELELGTTYIVQSRVNAQRVRDDPSGPLSPGSFPPRESPCGNRNHCMQPHWAAMS